jgi:hypothetical protein
MGSNGLVLGILAALTMVACSGAEMTGGETNATPAVVPTAAWEAQGDKGVALSAVRETWLLFDALAPPAGVMDGDWIAVEVLRVASLGDDVALSGDRGEHTLPLAPPIAPPDLGSALCDAAGCHFDHYLVPNFDVRSHVLDGDVSVQRDGNTRVLTIELSDQGPRRYAASLLATAVTLDGWVTAVSTEETSALGFVALTFDEREPFSEATPTSGSVYGEWLAPGYQGVKATVPLP